MVQLHSACTPVLRGPISHGASDAEVARTGLFERLLLNRNQLRSQMELFALLGFNGGTPKWVRQSDPPAMIGQKGTTRFLPLTDLTLQPLEFCLTHAVHNLLDNASITLELLTKCLLAKFCN